jgi:hypothetical protein
MVPNFHVFKSEFMGRVRWIGVHGLLVPQSSLPESMVNQNPVSTSFGMLTATIGSQ